MDVRLSTDAEISHDDGALHGPHARVPYTGVHHLVRRFLEPAQDTLVVLLALVLFGVMVRALVTLGSDVLARGLSFRFVVAEALFALVLVELQRLLIIYLRDHHVSVDVMVEATIVGMLREVLLLGALEIEPLRLFALTAFVLALGLLLRFGDLRAPRRRVRAHGAGHPYGAASIQRATPPAR
jgi:uncharacterized membrane protein (DUF373 family)